MDFKSIILLFVSIPAFAGYPPTTSKVSSDSSNIWTYNFLFPNFTGTHTGNTVSLGVNNVAGGGTNNSSYHAGSVIFAGTSGLSLTEDFSFPLSWDNTNKRFNIGATGTGKLNVTNAGGTDLGINVFSTSSNNAAQIQNQSAYSLSLINAAASAAVGASIGGAFSRGTLASRSQSLSGDQIFSITGQGYTGSTFGPGLTNAIAFVLSENTTSTHNGGEIVLATTPNTTLLPIERLRITNAGILQIKDGHLKSIQTTAPTATVQAGAGTGATCTLANATDIAGEITITTGSLLTPGTGAYCIITFNKAYGVAPICTVYPAGNTISTSTYLTRSTTTITFNWAAAALGVNTFVMNYNCMETQ